MLRLVVTTLTLGTLLNVIAITQADARHHRHRHHHHRTIDANGNTGVVVSHKTNASARVGAAHVAKFQAYINELEANGATIHSLGGIRRGRCSSGHLHPCGRALDVCQLRRGVVLNRCNLPPRDVIGLIAQRHGLFEGGQWCNHDYGHVQVGESAPACHSEFTMTASLKKGRVRHAHRYHRHRVRYARY